MGEWITVPSFATDEIVQAEKFQDIWTNLYRLFSPNYTETYFSGVSGGLNTTAGTTFLDVGTSTARLEFESFGGDILASVKVKSFNGVSNGASAFRFELDGVAYGNTKGQMRMQRYGSEGTFTDMALVHIFSNVSAGNHILDLQFTNADSGANGVIVYNQVNLNHFWILEF